MGIMFTPYVIANYLLQIEDMIFPTIAWIVLFCTWRVSMVVYDMIDDKNVGCMVVNCRTQAMFTDVQSLVDSKGVK